MSTRSATFIDRLDALELPDYGCDPTPDQIRELCGRIQTTWTKGERRKREMLKPTRWALPEMRSEAQRAV